MKRRLIAAGALAGIGLCLTAQVRIQFEHITVEDGLCQDSVVSIFQDSTGFMWFGTQDGLNRYDGHNFKNFNHNRLDPTSLDHDMVSCIAGDRQGFLWVGTVNGLNRYNPRTGKFIRFRNDRRQGASLNGNMVSALHEDRQGILWIGTTNGLNGLNRERKAFSTYQKDPRSPGSISSNSIKTIYEDQAGNLWIGTAMGLDRFERDRKQFVHYRIGSQNTPTDPRNSVNQIQEDQSGRLWLATMNGLHRFNPLDGTYKSYFNDAANPASLSDNTVSQVYMDGNHILWVGTWYGGLNRFDPQTDKFTCYRHEAGDAQSLSADRVFSIHEDRSGTLWIGVMGGGINKFDRKTQKFLHSQSHPTLKNSLSHDLVWSIHEGKDGVLWVGTGEGGLNRIDQKKQVYACYKNNPHDPNSIAANTVYSIYEDHAGHLWLGTTAGLDKLDLRANTFSHYKHSRDNLNSLSHNNVLVIRGDLCSDVLWIGTLDGLNKFEPGLEKFSIFKQDVKNVNSLNNNVIRAIHQDSDGILWVGTAGGGLNRFDPEIREFTHYGYDPQKPGSLSDNRINAILQDHAGTLWIGTSGGLNKFDRQKGVIKFYTRADGLAANIIFGILEDAQGNLWISGNKGICRFNPVDETFRYYHMKDGLQNYEFNAGAYFRNPSGLMYFGGVKGFNAFYPDRLKDNTYIPPVVITGFKIANGPAGIGQNSPLTQDISFAERLVLPYSSDNLSIEFAALDFTDPKKNQYKYKLEGFNADWVDWGTRHDVTFSNLNPGRYTFRVKGSNNDGLWNERGASLEIMIAPPFWATWWFRTLAGMLLLLSLFGLHEARTRQVKQRMEKRQLELELRLKADFTAMLVHDLRSPLSAVIGYAELLDEMPGHLDARKTGKMIRRSAEKMLNLINDMLDLSKFEAGKMSLEKSDTSPAAIVLDAIEIMNPLLAKKNIQLNSELDPVAKSTRLLIDGEKIGQVLINLLSNAIKYAPENGKVIVKVLEADRDDLEVSVWNNGPGIPDDQMKHLFSKYSQLNRRWKDSGTGLGLAVSKLIIVAHGGEIGCRPGQNGKGVTFYFRLPRQSGIGDHA